MLFFETRKWVLKQRLSFLTEEVMRPLSEVVLESPVSSKRAREDATFVRSSHFVRRSGQKEKEGCPNLALGGCLSIRFDRRGGVIVVDGKARERSELVNSEREAQRRQRRQ